MDCLFVGVEEVDLLVSAANFAVAVDAYLVGESSVCWVAIKFACRV